MQGLLVSSSLGKAHLGEVLAASDVAYFRAAADNIHCHGGVLSHVPGFSGLSLACVLHSLDAIIDINTWVGQLEDHIAGLGMRWVRFYLQESSGAQREQLQKLGYRELVELGFATRLAGINHGDVALKPCSSETQWRQYTQLSIDSVGGPDGFDMVGDSYVRVSRLKVDAGYMKPYLAFLGDRFLGFVNLSMQGGFARCKNLLVHPQFRGKGVGAGIVNSAMMEARKHGAGYFGCYAIAGEPSVELYRGLGMVEVTRQTEWSKPLDVA